MAKLTERERWFIHHLMTPSSPTCGNVSASARAAGYAKGSGYAESLHKKPAVAAEIARIRAEQEKAAEDLHAAFKTDAVRGREVLLEEVNIDPRLLAYVDRDAGVTPDMAIDLRLKVRAENRLYNKEVLERRKARLEAVLKGSLAYGVGTPASRASVTVNTDPAHEALAQLSPEQTEALRAAIAWAMARRLPGAAEAAQIAGVLPPPKHTEAADGNRRDEAPEGAHQAEDRQGEGEKGRAA